MFRTFKFDVTATAVYMCCAFWQHILSYRHCIVP